MLRLVVSASTFALMSGFAIAADLPTMAPPPAPMLSTTPIAYNWSGFYIGAHGGWGFGGGAFDDGFVVGGQIGINWQFNNNFVVGLEGDGSFSDLGGVDSLQSIRGRVGLAFDRFLVYGTGGGGFADFEEVGWVAGGGVEYAFTDFISAGVEYLHYDIDGDTADVIRGRVNARFNSLFGM